MPFVALSEGSMKDLLHLLIIEQSELLDGLVFNNSLLA